MVRSLTLCAIALSRDTNRRSIALTRFARKSWRGARANSRNDSASLFLNATERRPHPASCRSDAAGRRNASSGTHSVTCIFHFAAKTCRPGATRFSLARVRRCQRRRLMPSAGCNKVALSICTGAGPTARRRVRRNRIGALRSAAVIGCVRLAGTRVRTFEKTAFRSPRCEFADSAPACGVPRVA